MGELRNCNTNMNTDQKNRIVAEDCIAQLSRSERGRACLVALDTFLRDDATYSLDGDNQAAVLALVAAAFRTPSVREMLS